MMADGKGFEIASAERWLAWLRLGAVPFAVFQVALSADYPPGYRPAAWIVTGTFAAGTAGLFGLSRTRVASKLAPVALAFDSLVVYAYVLIYSFEPATPIRQLVFLPIIEAALRYGLVGSVALAFASAPVVAVFEWLRLRRTTLRSYT